MSHVFGGTVVINDIEALVEAIAKFPRLKFKRDQKTYRWYGAWMNDYSANDAAYKNGIDPKDYGKSEHAIEVNGSSYDVGVVKRKDGKGYTLVWDFYGTGGNINHTIGASAEKLMKEYNRAVIMKQARSKGYTVQTKKVQGKEQLVLTKF